MPSLFDTLQSTNQHNLALISSFRRALYDYEPAILQQALKEIFSPDCIFNLSFPLETLPGTDAFHTQAIKPLAIAVPDLERRDYITMAGEVQDAQWVGCAGYYTGVFEKPWLDIPPTGQQMSMRFHEFYRIADNRVVEVQGLWDIPEVMHQANAWPLAPTLGRDWQVPGPATQDGIRANFNTTAEITNASLLRVHDMLADLDRFAAGGASAMNLAEHWHPKMNWYGPAGIGTNRRISGFRYWHQIPFLNALPDRQGGLTGGALFSDDNYVGFTSWPGMTATITGDGWMGIVPGNQPITMRSLDFWRCENGLIRENWVLVDLLSIYDQIGVDVFARMRGLTAHRQARPIDLWTTGHDGDHDVLKS